MPGNYMIATSIQLNNLSTGLVTPFTVNDKDFIREVVTKGIEGGGNKYVGRRTYFFSN